jgi:hypothetical protein
MSKHVRGEFRACAGSGSQAEQLVLHGTRSSELAPVDRATTDEIEGLSFIQEDIARLNAEAFGLSIGRGHSKHIVEIDPAI